MPIRYGIAYPGHVDVYPTQDAAIRAVATLDPGEPGTLARTTTGGEWETTHIDGTATPLGPVTEAIVQPLRPWGRHEIDAIASRYGRNYLGLNGA